MIKKKSLLLSGYYGMNNYGDDLFAISCVEGIKQSSPAYDPKVLTTSIRNIEGDCVIPAWLSKERYYSQGRLGSIVRLISSYWYSHKERNVVFAGGSLFSSAPQGVIKLLSVSPYLNFSAIGVSIGPYKNSEDERLSKEFLKRFNYLTLRDNASYELAKSWEIDVPIGMYGDLVGVIPKLNLFEPKVNSTNTPIIGVSMCNYESFTDGDIKQESARIDAMSAGIVDVAKRINAEVHVFSLNNHPIVGDDSVAMQFLALLKAEGIKFNVFRNDDLGALALWEKIAQCSAFMSVRLHGAMTAYLNKIPFVLIEYHKKCTDFLDDIGQNEQYRIQSTDIDSAMYSTCLEAILNKNYRYPSIDSDFYADKATNHFSFLG